MYKRNFEWVLTLALEHSNITTTNNNLAGIVFFFFQKFFLSFMNLRKIANGTEKIS